MVLVTTKKAEAGKFSVSYNNSFGLQQITYLPDAVWDPILYMKGFDKAYENEGRAPLYADIIEEYKEGMKVDPYTYPATDWFDLYFRDLLCKNIIYVSPVERPYTNWFICRILRPRRGC